MHRVCVCVLMFSCVPAQGSRRVIRHADPTRLNLTYFARDFFPLYSAAAVIIVSAHINACYHTGTLWLQQALLGL